MKKNYLLLLLWMICQSGLSLFAQPSVTVPEGDKYYNIQQGESGFYLTRVVGMDGAQIKVASQMADQIFVFEPVPEEDSTYYIKNILNDEYMVRSDISGGDQWTLIWVADPTSISNLDDGKYQIVPIDTTTDYIQIKNLGSNAWVGSDQATDGSTVYGNKDVTAAHFDEHLISWKIKEYSSNVDKTALQKELDAAYAFFDATEQGSGSDQYPLMQWNTLAEQISEAQDVMDNENATQAEVNAILLSLTQALQDYKNSVNPMQPDTNQTYYIIHSSGFYFDADYIVIADPNYTADQQYQFVPAVGKTAVYSIMQVSSGKYLTRQSDGWDLALGTDPTVDLAQFQIKSTGTGYYTITCQGLSGTASNSCWGTDNNTVNSGVYTDKTGTDGKHYWIIQDIRDQGVVKTALQAAINKVTTFLSNTRSGDGSDQVPAAEYDALTAALSAANAVLTDSNATQSEVGDATMALNDALAACIAAINPFLPDTAEEYNIIHSGGLYFGEYSNDTDDNLIGIFPQTGGDDQKFQFVAVPDSTGIYNIKNVATGQYLTRSVAPHLGGDGYQQVDGSGNPMFDDYALVWGDDPTTALAQFIMKRAGNQNYYTIKCDTVGPYRTNSYMGVDVDSVAVDGSFPGVFIDKDGTSVLHYWNIVLASESSVKSVAVNTAIVYANGGMLTVDRLTGNNRIAIYAITGQAIENTETAGSIYAKTLPKGTYIVVVQGNSTYHGVVIVK